MYVCIYTHQKGQRIPKSFNNNTYLIKYSTIKHKYDVTFDIISPMEMICWVFLTGAGQLASY